MKNSFLLVIKLNKSAKLVLKMEGLLPPPVCDLPPKNVRAKFERA
jgi:hypothetical protein